MSLATPIPCKPIAGLSLRCPSCGEALEATIGFGFGGSSPSGSQPSPQRDKPESCATDSDCSSPSPQHSPAPGCGPSSSSTGSGPQSGQCLKKPEIANSRLFGSRVPRCNDCSALFLDGKVTGAECSCGCGAWFLSKVTIPEKIAFLLGFYKMSDTKVLGNYNAPLGGELSHMEAAVAAQEKENGRSIT